MSFLIGQLSQSTKVERGTQFIEYPTMLTTCLELLSAFSGMERENINRGSGWLFISIGRRLERAMYLTRQLHEITQPLAEQDWPLLEYLLEVQDSSVTYRTRYYTTLQPLAVLDVLMADPGNPRSLDFQLSHIADLYEKLPRHVPADLEAMQIAVDRLRAFDLQEIDYPLPGADTAQGPRYERLTKLHSFLKDLEQLLPSWSNNLSSRYFSHARTLPIIVDE
jgi:uncharacterized alpha-E superfamily protein